MPPSSLIHNNPVTNFIPCENELEEENFTDSEPETIALLEIIRQFYEKDRRKKLQQKAMLQEMQFQKKPTPMTTTTQVQEMVDGKPMVIKLSQGHQETVRMLFQNRPPHYKIEGSAVESLIKILGGKIDKNTGSTIIIHWGNSKKIAGTYEVAHGGPDKGHLTSEWAIRVAAAINVGIRIGYIAEETIAQYLPQDSQ